MCMVVGITDKIFNGYELHIMIVIEIKVASGTSYVDICIHLMGHIHTLSVWVSVHNHSLCEYYREFPLFTYLIDDDN